MHILGQVRAFTAPVSQHWSPCPISAPQKWPLRSFVHRWLPGTFPSMLLLPQWNFVSFCSAFFGIPAWFALRSPSGLPWARDGTRYQLRTVYSRGCKQTWASRDSGILVRRSPRVGTIRAGAKTPAPTRSAETCTVCQLIERTQKVDSPCTDWKGWNPQRTGQHRHLCMAYLRSTQETCSRMSLPSFAEGHHHHHLEFASLALSRRSWCWSWHQRGCLRSSNLGEPIH